MGEHQHHEQAAPEQDTSPPPRTERRRRRRRRFATWQDEWTGQPLGTAVLGALLIIAPQLLGGVLPWTVTAIALLSLVALALVGLRTPAAAQSYPRLGLVLLGVGVWTALQTLPLPCSLVELLSPNSVAKLRSLRSLLNDPNAGACTITQDPGATQLEVVKGIAILSSFSVAWLFAASGGRRKLLWLIAGSSLVLSLVALAHGAFELDRVFGVYTPVGIVRRWLLSPLMNPNNLGGFAALGVPLWIGLSYRVDGLRVRLACYAALTITSATAVLSLSRGAIGQLLASVVIMAFIIYRKRAQRGERTRAALPLREIGAASAGAAGLGLGAYLVGDEALRDFSTGRLDKLELGVRALRFAADHALTGVGRGAFGSAFVGLEGGQARYRYAENFVAQWAADWGLPVAVALLGVIAYELIHVTKRTQSLAHLGACTALFAFAAQNLVDFGLELVGVAVVAAALLAACVAPSPDDLPPPEDVSVLRRSSSVAVALLAVGLALLGLLGPRAARQSVPALTAELRAILAQGDRAAFKQKLGPALVLHPAEPVLTLLAASESLAHKDPKTLAWLNRSMQLAPGWARPHELAFRWLWQHGQGRQALLELKAAAAIDAAAITDTACRLGQVNAEWALAAAPDNDQRARYLERLSSCITTGPQSADFDAAVLRELPNALYPLWHEAERRFEAGEVDEALDLVARLRRTHPDFDHAVVVRYNMLLKAGRLRELVSEIDTSLVGVGETKQIELLRLKALALARAGSIDLAREALTDLRRRSTTDPVRLAQSYTLEGQIHLEQKEVGAALAAYRESYRINADTGTLRTIASIAESLGDRAQALWAYINLCQREPLGGGCERRNALLSGQSAKIGR